MYIINVEMFNINVEILKFQRLNLNKEIFKEHILNQHFYFYS
jgi:hypothetical protein